MSITEYPDRELLTMKLANTLASDLKNALLVNETASLVVPGGTTPGPIFDGLCAADLDWDRVHVLLSDERWVPDDHPRSNAKLLRERLLVERAAKARFTPYYVQGMESDAGAASQSKSLNECLPISVLLLGMGADMHTASLFPGAIGLQAALDAKAPTLCAIQAEGQEPRVSLSAQVLDNAMHKHLVIFGDEKREALENAMTLPPEEAPIGAVLNNMTLHWAP